MPNLDDIRDKLALVDKRKLSIAELEHWLEALDLEAGLSLEVRKALAAVRALLWERDDGLRSEDEVRTGLAHLPLMATLSADRMTVSIGDGLRSAFKWIVDAYAPSQEPVFAFRRTAQQLLHVELIPQAASYSVGQQVWDGPPAARAA